MLNSYQSIAKYTIFSVNGSAPFNTNVHVLRAQTFLIAELSICGPQKGPYEYRLRWDNVKYEPGELKAVAYKNGKPWAEQTLQTTGEPTALRAAADRTEINADGEGLSFITVRVMDSNGLLVPNASNRIEFSIEGPGEIVATDNGNPAGLLEFSSKKREAFNGLALAIVRSQEGLKGTIRVTAKAPGLKESVVEISTYLD